MRFNGVAAVAALLGCMGGAEARNATKPALFPHDPVPSIPRGGCAVSCSETGPSSSRWAKVHRFSALDHCNKTQLLDSNIRFPLEFDDDTPNLRACTASDADDDQDYGPPCATGAKDRSAKADVQVLSGESSGSKAKSSPADVVEAAKQLARNLKVDPTCREITQFAKKGSAVLGVFIGKELRKSSVVLLIEKYIDYVNSAGDSLPSISAAQICGPKGQRASRHTFGIIADRSGDIQAVNNALGKWHDAECLEGLEAGDVWADQALSVIPATAITMGARKSVTPTASNFTTGSNATATATVAARSDGYTPWDRRSLLLPRAECKTYEVKSGDDCYTIATDKCKLKNLAALYKLNSGAKKLCEGPGINPGDHFCCTEGTMPDFSPKPNKDGTCKHVLVGKGDTCDSLAKETCDITPKQFYEYNKGVSSKSCDLTPKDIICCSPGDKPDLRPKKNKDGTCHSYAINNKLCDEIKNEFFLKDGDLTKFNEGKTWGWAGCERLQPHQKICLSEGDPPLPAEDANAICGPTVVGTKKPANGKDFADLNPCPLNACCNIWGQCGVTENFCVDTKVKDTPGTAKNGTDGCVSNCGTDIVNNDEGPSSFSAVAYFEAWNKDRACLNMNITEINEKAYTHIHFSFGTITDAFKINVNDVQEQFDKMKDWDTSLKKIISFGGWAFSTEPATIEVFRNGVKPANRETFADAIVAFVKEHNLDGVDFDWEYPGADDIVPGSPGSPEDGPNYLKFLEMVRDRLPEGKSVSIAAPASYWYLRWFPIDKISKVVDYIIYMTYDLHGQWDVDNESAQPGCKSGSCLRSHVNITETKTALSMVTKAGVKSSKLFVGVSSFGRSFKMAKEGCTGPQCEYLGERNKSPAKEGECTGEGGYLADAEILQIMRISNGFGGGDYKSWYDEDSDSDILVYDDVEWVAYMGSDTKTSRTDWYKGLNFGGVSDWAVDLGADRADAEALDGDPIEIGDYETCDWDATFSNLEDLANKSDGMDPVCASVHTLRILSKMLGESLNGYDEAADGYDGKFDTYADYIKSTLNTRLEDLLIRSDENFKYFKCFAKIGQLDPDKDEAEELPCEDVNGKPGMFESWSFWWELIDEAGWNETLWDEGIDPGWVEPGTYLDEFHCHRESGGTGACMDSTQSHYGFPRGRDDIEIPDPKEIVDKARGNLDKIDSEFFARELDISLDQWEGSPEDAVQVLSAPVFMLSDAVDSMVEVKKMGEEIEEEEKKNLILTILSGVLFLIPFLGPAIGSLGRAGATIARMLSAVDAAASAGLGIYEIIEDPESAPLAIMLMLVGGAGSIGGAKGYRNLAKPRKDLDSAKMGNTWKKQDPHIQKIMGNACKRK